MTVWCVVVVVVVDSVSPGLVPGLLLHGESETLDDCMLLLLLLLLIV